MTKAIHQEIRQLTEVLSIMSEVNLGEGQIQPTAFVHRLWPEPQLVIIQKKAQWVAAIIGRRERWSECGIRRLKNKETLKEYQVRKSLISLVLIQRQKSIT